MPDALELEGATCRICGEGTGHHHNLMSYVELCDKIQHLKARLLGDEEQTASLSDHHYSFIEQEQETPVLSEDILEEPFPEQEPRGEPKHFCCVCYNNFYSQDGMVVVDQKVHDICLECMNSYLKEEILNMRV